MIYNSDTFQSDTRDKFVFVRHKPITRTHTFRQATRQKHLSGVQHTTQKVPTTICANARICATTRLLRRLYASVLLHFCCAQYPHNSRSCTWARQTRIPRRAASVRLESAENQRAVRSCLCAHDRKTLSHMREHPTPEKKQNDIPCNAVGFDVGNDDATLTVRFALNLHQNKRK